MFGIEKLYTETRKLPNKDFMVIDLRDKIDFSTLSETIKKINEENKTNILLDEDYNVIIFEPKDLAFLKKYIDLD